MVDLGVREAIKKAIDRHMQPGKPGGLPHVSPTGPTNIDVPKQEEMTAYTVDDLLTLAKICFFGNSRPS